MSIPTDIFLRTIAQRDDYGFLEVQGNWDNHKPLLYLAIFLSNPASDVVEFGSGLGSTVVLRNWCASHNRRFASFDSDKLWAEKTGALWVKSWDEVSPIVPVGLLFLDHAPGERRQVDLARWANFAEVIVCHDTEIGGAGAYGWDFSPFPYQLHLNRYGGGAGASLLSKTIEVDRFSGMELGKFKFDI